MQLLLEYFAPEPEKDLLSC